MASDAESLRALEALMNEFFAVQTSNERKRGIEHLLENFSQQRGSWKHCLYFMAHTTNHYVCMYCLTTIESVINKQWVGLLGEEKAELRSTLYQFLLEHHQGAPHFIRNKLVKLVVDIARLDWPHFYPDFFSNIMQLIQISETTILGLVFLQTTSEELACPREDLSVSRKEELRRLLLDQVPQVLTVLTGILESVLEKQKHVVTATPPPSPTHGQPSDSSKSLFSTSPVHTGSLLSSIFSGLGSRNPFWTTAPLDIESEQICGLVLRCLAHLFSWIPLSSYITPNLLTVVFHYASFGADPQHNKRSLYLNNSNANSSSGNPSLGVLAMGAINEIMYKNCVPTDFEDFLLQMFQNTFHLLQRLVQDMPNNDSRMRQLEEGYVEKFTEFLRLFVSVHLRRFEGNSQFPVLELLALLFKYTFQQLNLDGFFSCLDIWTIFLDYLSTKLKNRQADQGSIIERYHEALVSLVVQILRKMQFKFNQAELEELDDESLDDDDKTEWQHFLQQCVETLSKVAELMPSDTYSLVYDPWRENVEIYLGLGNALVPDGSAGDYNHHLNVTQEHECHRLHCILRDLSSLLQAIGRLSSHFIGEPFHDRFSTAQSLVERLVAIAAFGSKVKLYRVEVSADVLKSDFIEVHAQTLAALKAWCHWLAQLYGEGAQNTSVPQHQLCTCLISNVIAAVAPIISDDEPDKLVHSSVHLLVTLTGTVRPPVLWELTEMRELYQRVPQMTSFQAEASRLLQRSLANVLLLPWPGTSNQHWEQRQEHLSSYIKTLTADFRHIRELPDFSENKNMQDQAKPVISRTLQLIGDEVENIMNEITQTKKLCYSCIQDLVQETLWLFPIYVHQPDICEEILGFFLVIFDVLQPLMGVPFAETTIQTFLDVFTREQLSHTILHESSAGARVVEKFLNILQLIVKEPGSSFCRFVPSTITLCMDHIYPIIAERSSPDIKAQLFELLYHILLHNWQYFFKSSVLTSLGAPGNEAVENKPQFVAIMQAFGQSFLQPDIAIFRQNLEALESLNAKWKLYHKGLYRETMLAQFLNVLLQVLIHKSHDLLQEEIAITVYNMASVDFDVFYNSFLPEFLRGTDGLDDNQRNILKRNFKVETDLPSFTWNVHRFVNDLRYYRLCNCSLPAGSVSLEQCAETC